MTSNLDNFMGPNERGNYMLYIENGHLLPRFIKKVEGLIENDLSACHGVKVGFEVKPENVEKFWNICVDLFDLVATVEKASQHNINAFLGYLNNIVKHDPEALTSIIEHRVDCSDFLINHPNIPVYKCPDDVYRIGMLGIIQGFFAESGYKIVANYAEDGWISSFSLTKQ